MSIFFHNKKNEDCECYILIINDKAKLYNVFNDEAIFEKESNSTNSVKEIKR